jgi:uncharacterized protein YdeI (YjbR/CyaY-like superfamily)
MAPRPPRGAASIPNAAYFAQPILTHLREVVHAACPDVQETMKWSMPFFDYHGVMCNMAAFRQHATFGFWKGALIPGLAPNSNSGGDSMGNLGRLTSVKDLPSRKVLAGYVKAAMRLNEDGVAVRTPKKAPKPEATVPSDLAAALKKNRKAATTFEGFPPGHRREYVSWITEAKREETRAKRVAQAVEWLAEGKPRNWKYASR